MVQHLGNQQSKVLSLTRDEITRGVLLCIENAKRLVDSCEALLDKNSGHALGLYSLALEEYGKALWLKELEASCKPAGSCLVPNGVFSNHIEKFRRAANKLDKTCAEVPYGVKRRNPRPVTKEVWYMPTKDDSGARRARKCVSIGEEQTGIFKDLTPTTPKFYANITTRMDIFYVDCFYIGTGNDVQWSPLLVASERGLIRAIEAFRKKLDSPLLAG